METTGNPKFHNILAVQPSWCREKLPEKDLSALPAYMKRLLEYDPTALYESLRYRVDPYSRYNYENINFAELFPPTPGVCACGCGKPSRETYYDKDCQFFAICVWEVIGGRQAFIGEVFKHYNGHDKCTECNERKFVDIDHIFPVSKGGGACWLSNFQPLCKKCHKAKTRSDFNWTKLKTTKDE